MSTLADDALGWANCVAVVTMSWTFLCVFRFITQPSSYPARPHWRSNMWSAIDVLPWAVAGVRNVMEAFSGQCGALDTIKRR